jgi:anti-sigma regulatory factor (Ser/Thr protein kinase)
MSGSRAARDGGRGPRGRSDDGLELPFDGESLVALRSTVAAHGGRLGLGDARVDDLVLVAHELASNAVRHGGGKGRLRMWRDDRSVFCEVADGGPGFAYERPDGSRRPSLGATGGRGLWIVSRLVDELQVSTVGGTIALVEIRLDDGRFDRPTTG